MLCAEQDKWTFYHWKCTHSVVPGIERRYKIFLWLPHRLTIYFFLLFFFVLHRIRVWKPADTDVFPVVASQEAVACCCQPVVVVAFDVAGNLVIVVKFTLQSVFSNPHQNPRHASERSRRIHSSCILSFDLIGRHKNKRPNVTEIILLLGFADVTFLVERSEDRKNVCVRRLIWILPFQKRHLYNYFTDNRIVIFKVVRTLHYMV